MSTRVRIRATLAGAPNTGEYDCPRCSQVVSVGPGVEAGHRGGCTFRLPAELRQWDLREGGDIEVAVPLTCDASQNEDETGHHTCVLLRGHEPPGAHRCKCGHIWGDRTPATPAFAFDGDFRRLGADDLQFHAGGVAALSDDTRTVELNHRFKGYRLHEALLHSGMVRRYHTHPAVVGQPQTVAEHTFRAVALLISLWPESSKQAIIGLLCHDGAEGVVGDISSTVKKMYPGLGDALDAIEASVFKSLGIDVEGALDEETRRRIRICDWLEGAFYAIDQMHLGNRGMVICHNAYIHALNKLGMTAEERDAIKDAHHRYIRESTGALKVDLAYVNLLDQSGSEAPEVDGGNLP